MPEETVRDKVARLDHDTLVRVETVVNNMAVDLKSLADGSALRLTSAEARLTALEKINDEVKPSVLLMTVTDHDRQIRDFKTTIRNLNWMLGGSLIGLFSVIAYFTKVFGLKD